MNEAAISIALCLIGVLSFLLGRCSVHRQSVSGTGTDNGSARDIEQRTEDLAQRAGELEQREVANNQRAADNNQQAEELINRGKEILEEVYFRR